MSNINRLPLWSWAVQVFSAFGLSSSSLSAMLSLCHKSLPQEEVPLSSLENFWDPDAKLKPNTHTCRRLSGFFFRLSSIWVTTTPCLWPLISSSSSFSRWRCGSLTARKVRASRNCFVSRPLGCHGRMWTRFYFVIGRTLQLTWGSKCTCRCLSGPFFGLSGVRVAATPCLWAPVSSSDSFRRRCYGSLTAQKVRASIN